MKEDAKEAINLPVKKDELSQKRRVGWAVAVTQVEEIESADWTELGMPETLWKCRVKEFGPLIVSIDAHGNNLFEQNKVKFNEKKDEALAEILPQVGFIK